MAKQSKPYYGEKTKKKIVEDYFRDSVTMKELSELHGIFGSNTVADWIKKNGHLNSKKTVPIMNEDTQNEEAKTGRKNASCAGVVDQTERAKSCNQFMLNLKIRQIE